MKHSKYYFHANEMGYNQIVYFYSFAIRCNCISMSQDYSRQSLTCDKIRFIGPKSTHWPALVSYFDLVALHDDVIKWKHFPRNWPFVRGIHRSRWIPRTSASDAELWCFFDLLLNKWLSKQPWGWRFQMPSWSLWRQCNDISITKCQTIWYNTWNAPYSFVAL